MNTRSRTSTSIALPALAQEPVEHGASPRGRLRHNRRRVPVPDPIIVARNFDALTRGAATYQERKRRVAALARDPVAMSAVPLDQIREYLSRRQFEVAILHLGQYRLSEIARLLGYAAAKHVHAVLKTPAVKRFIELVEDAQIERVIAGEFGVRAQARAAAPRVMEHVIEKAGGKQDRTGQRQGVALKDSDAIRAAELVLTVAGEKVERSMHHHVHDLFATMTTDELRRLGDHGEWPDRLQRTVRALGLGGSGAGRDSE
jgi:hypothetical protein